MDDNRRRKRISLLHVDDSEDYLLLTKVRLGKLDENIEIVNATDGDTAIAKLEERSFTCILSDVQMPTMDGLALLKTLRDNGDATPVIFLTACEDERVESTALHSGASDFIPKDLGRETYERILSAVHRTLERLKPDHRTTPPPAPRPGTKAA